jgi:hypothetical protein
MKLTKQRRLAVRVAARIREHLTRQADRVNLDLLPVRQWDELQKSAGQLRLTQARGWLVASGFIKRDLSYATNRLMQALQTFHTQLSWPRERTPIAPAAEILADLQELAEEFEEAEIDLQAAKITVRTEPIVLADFDLGAFRIALSWNQIGRSYPYEVVAIEPTCPNGHEGVTHPHVQDRKLCEGEGAAAIRAALASGRLLDFFVLVRQILRTYNPGSAYVQLGDWNGVPCQDCGHRMDYDDRTICDRCEEPVCGDCSLTCSGCECWLCASCSQPCADCDCSFCRGCLSTPAGSTDSVCEACLEKRKEPDEEETGEAPAADAVCVGQAAATA